MGNIFVMSLYGYIDGKKIQCYVNGICSSFWCCVWGRSIDRITWIWRWMDEWIINCMDVVLIGGNNC